ncbi:MAG: nuclear transport factor 2 family protein [Pseudomonadota bacterium]
MNDDTDRQALKALNARIQRLEDIEAIRQLKATYCDVCDDGHNPDRIVTIFTEDCIWEARGIGTANGRDELRALFERFGSMMSFTQHMTMNPRIEVDGDTATGRWYLFGPFTFPANKQAKWQAARYEETYARVEGEWLIKHLKVCSPQMSVKYEQGWGETLFHR